MADPRPPLAVVGVSALFPGSSDAAGFWRDILAGRDLIGDVPETHWLVSDYHDPDPQAPDKTYARRGAFLNAVDFDPLEHGVPPSIVPATDTSQLLALIAAKQVLEDATRADFRHLDRDRVSVILGVTSAQELLVEMGARLQRPVWVKALRESGLPEDEVQRICDRIAASYVPWQESTFPGLLGNVIAGRIANRLNLGGTNCITDAACASSFSALAMAANELYLGDSDLAIVGGVETFNDIFMYMCFSKTPALSPSGDCRPFAKGADGTMLGEGIGMVALRRLADAERDADRIYAVIRGIGASSDGRAKSVYAPVPAGQAKALRRAYAAAGYAPDTVELMEAHGTGTKAGDTAEFEALRQVFDESGREDRQWCALGSVKSQVGHTKAAAGAAGLFKIVMALHHRVLPPTIKVDEPHPGLDLGKSAFYLSTRARPWVRGAGHPRRASVSSFGFGGSNFHVTAEEYRGPAPRAAHFLCAQSALVLLGAASRQELRERCREAAREAETAGVLDALAWDSRERFDASSAVRLAIVAADELDLGRKLEQAIDALEREPGRPLSVPGLSYGGEADPGRVAFLFPGQGSQYLEMGADLALAFEAAARVWDDAAGVEAHLHEVVFPRPVFGEQERRALEQRLTATEWAQPAVGVASLAQLALLDQAGLQPDLLAGHSFGELTALCAASALSREEFVRAARRRGELMAEAARQPGAMVAVALPADEVLERLAGWQIPLALANHNAPRQVVLSGELHAIDEAARRFAEIGARVTRLPVSTAFHSPLVAPASGPFLDFLAELPFRAPERPVFSNSEAAAYPRDPDAIRSLLASQIARPVRFVEEIEAMYAAGARTFVEVGPGSVLTSLVGECLAGRPHAAVSLDRKGQHGVTALWHALGRLIAHGVRLDAARLFDGIARPKDPRKRKAALTLAITGANYGKPYPPKGGAAALPKPNPPKPAQPDSREAPAQRPAPALAETARTQPAAVSGDWLAAYEQMQRQTADAHETYLRTMAESHTAFLEATRASFAALHAAIGGEPASAPLPRVESQRPDAEAPAIATPAVPAPAAAQPPASLTPPAPLAPAPPRPPASAAASTSMAPAPPRDLKRTLLEVVAEKTGYPLEMLSLEMQLEADLGIDSIKRVEILASLQQRVPELPDVKAAEIGALGTLGQIVAFLDQQRPETDGGVVQPAIAVAAAPAPRNGTAAAGRDLKALLLSVVAEKTGYPAEMLSLEMDLEADLGIDSIKRVEILAAMQERLPGLPEVKAAEMGSLRTLGHVLARMNEAPAQALHEVRSGVAAPAEPPVDRPAGRVGRFEVRTENAPGTGSAVRGLLTSGPVFVTDEQTGVAAALAARLRGRGIEAAVVNVVPEHARCVVFLGGLRAVRSVDEAVDVNREAFRAAKAVAGALADAEGCFVTVQDTGGAFGFERAAEPRVWLAGLPGLVKSAAQEWPRAGLKAIDVESTRLSAGDVAALIERELLTGGAEAEVGLARGQRSTPACREGATPSGDGVVDETCVIVATGGARGITARCLVELAARWRPRLALLGRTVRQDEPPFCWGILDEAGLRRALAEAHRSEGRDLTAAELRAEVRAILANREIAAALEALRSAGSDAVYVTADVQDARALEAALAGVRERFGPITGIVHGAGVLADKLIADKTVEQFERVFSTKVRGLRALLEATRQDPLRLIALFSSVAARCGNVGQSDYAMGNEVLNKVAQAEALRRGPACAVKSLNFGPWDGGMVGPELRARFEERGVALIAPETGARLFADELRKGGGVEVVLGAEPHAGALLGRDRKHEVSLDFFVSRETHPFLSDHRIQGVPVIPLVLVHEWFARAARACRADLVLAAMRDVRVLRGVRLADFDSGRGQVLRVSCREISNGGKALLALELSQPGAALHYTATAEMAESAAPLDPGSPLPEPQFEAPPWPAEALYGGPLFHGPEFQAIRRVLGVGRDGAAAHVSGTAAGWAGGPWHSDAALLDAGLQLAILWGLRVMSKPSLPTCVGSIAVRVAPADGGLLRCVLTSRETSPLRTLCDVAFFSAAGERMIELRGVEMHALAEATAPGRERETPAISPSH